MKPRLESLFLFVFVWVVAGLFGSGLAFAQGQAPDAAPAATTNAPPGTNAAAPAPPVRPNGADLLPTIDRKYLTFGLDRIPLFRDVTLIGIPLWQYVASFLFIFFAFYIAKFVDFTVRVWLKRWAARTPTRTDDLLLEVAHGPVKVVAFVIFLHVGLSVFPWPPRVEGWFSNCLMIVVAISLTYAAMKVVDIAVGIWRRRSAILEDKHFDQQLIPMIRNTLKVVVAVIAALVTLDNIGINITGLVASLSIGGLAVGLAAQDTLANLFGAVAVLVDKPFKVGDRVKFDDIDGTIERIGLRSTRVRNSDGHLITVPNKTMGNATLTNVTQRPNIRTLMNFGLTYDTPPAQVKRATDILEEVFRHHPNTHDVWISFDKFGDFSLNLFVVHWWNNTDYRAYLKGMNDINLEIKRRFDAEKINFAFPSQTLFLKQDSDLRLQIERNRTPSSTEEGQEKAAN